MSQQRYLIKEILGKGGMGAVYRAYDNETRREVTLKTLLDVQDRAMLDLFYRECQVLATLNHPNIVDIYDVGEMLLEGSKRPYFVMPLLAGETLDKLIASASHRLSPDAVVDILSQAARGLHAAHERGLVHRDIKPSNIFVMEDDSVKIIDFGVAHLADGRTSTTLKGTLHYMAPEQLQMKKPSALSDLFSLAVVAYQTFTRRRPFEGAGADETIQAILHRIPPAVSDLNPAVSRAVGQVVHKAMAKQPYHRFASLREFSDYLQRAQRGETLDLFDDSKILPRVERARKAVEAGELDFASEVLQGLESEGFLHGDMAGLRRQVDDGIRGRAIAQRLAAAKRFLEEEEFQLAITKIQELLQTDPGNREGLALKAEIESRRSAEQVSRWLKLAHQHVENHSYPHARQALENVLALRPHDPEARKHLSSIVEREHEYLRLRKEKEAVYRAAVAAFERGEVSAALNDMERVLDLDKRAPESAAPETGAAYQQFYNQVRSDHDTIQAAYAETRRLLHERAFRAALQTCETVLARYPQHALFQALKVDIEQQARQDLSAFVARIDRDVEQERDLERRISILEHALAERPGEEHFEQALKLTMSKRDLVNGIVAKARTADEKGLYQDALSQWEMLRSIYPIYPGIEFEIERLAKRREQQSRTDALRDWVRRIDQALAAGRYDEAQNQLRAASVEFAGDAELAALEKLVTEGRDRLARAHELLTEGRRLCESGEVDRGLRALQQARAFDESNPQIRASAIDILVKQARALMDRDWRGADRLVREAARLEPGNPMANSLQALLEDRRRAELIDSCVTEARQHQTADQLDAALTAVDRGLREYPREARLLQLRAALERTRTTAPTVRPVTDDEATLVIPGVTDLFATTTQAPTAVSPVAHPSPPPPPPPLPQPPAPVPITKSRTGPPMGLAATLLALLLLVGLFAIYKLTSGPAPVPPKASETAAPPDITPTPAPPVEEAKPAEPSSQPAAAAAGPVVARGSVLLSIAEPGFMLTLNGKPFTGFVARGPGKYQINGLAPGRYRLAAQKAGFRAEPESALVTVAENKVVPVTLTLAPLGLGRWSIQGLRPGTEVWLAGGRQLGTAGAGGAVSGSDLPEGTHDIELRLKGYHRKPGLKLTTKNGGETSLAAPELERIEVLLQLQGVEPKNASLTISQQTQPGLKYDGPATLRELPAQIKLPPGYYNLTFAAPGYEAETVNFDLKDYPFAPKLKLRRR